MSKLMMMAVKQEHVPLMDDVVRLLNVPQLEFCDLPSGGRVYRAYDDALQHVPSLEEYGHPHWTKGVSYKGEVFAFFPYSKTVMDYLSGSEMVVWKSVGC